MIKTIFLWVYLKLKRLWNDLGNQQLQRVEEAITPPPRPNPITEAQNRWREKYTNPSHSHVLSPGISMKEYNKQHEVLEPEEEMKPLKRKLTFR